MTTLSRWESVPLGGIARIFKGNGGTKEDEVQTGVPCIRYGDLYSKYETFITRAQSFVTPAAAHGYTPVRFGDVLFAGSGETIEEIGKSAVNLLNGDACCGGDILVCRPARAVNPRFLGYALDAPPSVAQKARMGRGVTVMHIYAGELKRLRVVLPPLDEQGTIVQFLDHADRRIRHAIRAKQKLIALLNEQKQAVIHRAVTRGLDPNVRLKPSDVYWLGDLPEHWTFMQLRRLVRRGRRITYGIVQPGEPDPTGRYMVRGQDYSFGWSQPETLFRVSDLIEAPYKRSRLEAGDLVLTIVGAGVGNVARVPAWLDGANITQTTARISVDMSIADPDFVAATLGSPVGRRNVDRYVKGAAQPGLNLEHVRLFLIPLPPLEEQRDIVLSIRGETHGMMEAIDDARVAIDLLREYRTRLISDVVTGKLDVREGAAWLTDMLDDTEPPDEIDVDESTVPGPEGLESIDA